MSKFRAYIHFMATIFLMGIIIFYLAEMITFEFTIIIILWIMAHILMGDQK